MPFFAHHQESFLGQKMILTVKQSHYNTYILRSQSASVAVGSG